MNIPLSIKETFIKQPYFYPPPKKNYVIMTKKELAEFEDLKKVNETLLQDNVALMNENKSLKSSIGGYQTSNANYRAKIAQLVLDLKHANDTNVHLAQSIDEKDKNIRSLKDDLGQCTKEFEWLRMECEDRKANLDAFLSLPWYKRIFL